MGEERPWEQSYPPGVRWDAPLEISTLPAMLDAFIAQWGPKPALEYRDRTTSYAELGGAVDAVASGLMDLGIRRGMAVALYLPNTPYHPVAFFAVLRCGGHVVHLSPLDAERELAFKLKDSGARIVVTTNVGLMALMARKMLADGLVDHVIVGDDAAFGPPALPTTPIPEDAHIVRFDRLHQSGAGKLPRPWPDVDVEDIALLQYTGGTTGKPKGAILTHANLSATCAIYKAWSDPQRTSTPGTDKVICVLPLFHMYALSAVMLRCFHEGNELLLRPRFDVQTTLHDIEVKRATVFPGVPTMWIALANTPGIEERDLSSLRRVGSGGAPLPVEVGERFHRLTGHRLVGGWGMTETSPAGTTLPLEWPPNKGGSVGVPLPGIMMDIVALDDPRRRLKPGEKGEIRIKGPNVTKGYWNAPRETESAFVDGYFLTGDVGTMDEDGYFYLVDRKKDMIVSGGFNVYPRTIEEAIYEHPGVAETIVIGVPDSYRGEAAKAFVRLKPGAAPFTIDELRAFLADKLGRYEMPEHLEFRDALPKTAVGKLSKKELVAEERQKAQSVPQPVAASAAE
ncbi:MAG TPA: dicarboxylate--CoA ligase PimA [Hyphomicrobiaceae bacterium]|jgi:long-chain acyl-CoA synthetase|nr:dicarboxylate--CoA ligase PimA [Hyphomicrobiaceae bacterium]